MMKELYEKMINESVAALQADIDVISKNRYNDFKIVDAKPYADAVAGMTCADGQSDLKMTPLLNIIKLLRYLKSYMRKMVNLQTA